MSSPIQLKKTKITLAVGTVLAGMAFAPAAFAECTVDGSTFVVDTNSDVTAADGMTTLREAVVLANANPDCDSITFDASLNNQTISLTDASNLAVTEDVNIVGPGSGLLTVTNGGTANDALNMSASDIGVSGITFDDMDATPTNSDLWISGSSSVTVEDIVIKNTRGFSISSSITGNVTLDNVTVSGTSTGNSLSGKTIIVRNSTFDNITGTYGGGIRMNPVADADISFINTSITGNSATATLNEAFLHGSSGGGIQVNPLSNDFTLNIEQSTISGNSANGTGGGIYIADRGAAADVNIVQSTISDNSAVYGGGIYVSNTGADIDVTNSVISGNTASSADVTDADVGVATMNFTAGNFSASYSFFGVNNTNVTDSGSGGSFLNGGDAMLAALAAGANGQQVHIPQTGSLLIDMGDPASPTCEGEEAVTDQVGNQRVVNSRVDIGAIESSSTPALAELCAAVAGDDSGSSGGGGSFSAFGLAFLAMIAGFVGFRRKSGK